MATSSAVACFMARCRSPAVFTGRPSSENATAPAWTRAGKSASDLEAVLAGIADGTVDAIATDHAPHPSELKQKSLAEAAFGIIGFETALGLALTRLVHTGRISLWHLVLLMSTNPARIINQPLGRLRVGGAADLTVFDPNLGWTYRVAESRSKSRNSPFDGWKLRGAVTATIVAGKIVCRRPA